MRLVAKHIPIAQSVIYHYYKNKDELLAAMYHRANKTLGEARAALPETNTAKEHLAQIIAFQFDYMEEITAVLKYYLYNRDLFAKTGSGTLPEKATLHIEEVLDHGVKTGEFVVTNKHDQAKVIAHSINGYLLEYFPHLPSQDQRKEITNTLVSFCTKALAA